MMPESKGEAMGMWEKAKAWSGRAASRAAQEEPQASGARGVMDIFDDEEDHADVAGQDWDRLKASFGRGSELVDEEPSLWSQEPASAGGVVEHWLGMHGDVSERLELAAQSGAAKGLGEIGVATACLERMLAAGLRLEVIAEAMVVIEDSGVRRAWAEHNDQKESRESRENEKLHQARKSK
jgi:hypothetical protein